MSPSSVWFFTAGNSMGSFAAEIVLAARPKATRKAKPRTVCDPIEAGRRVHSKERMKWLRAMSEDRTLLARDRDVAACIATRYANDKSAAWPGRETLARDLGVSLNTVARAIKQLAERGWIRIVSGRTTGMSNRYSLTWPGAVENSCGGDPPMGQGQPTSGSRVTHRWVTNPI